MEEKKIIPGEKKVELNDEQLDQVAGGIFIQPEGALTCSKCGKNFGNSLDRQNHEITCRG